MGSGLNAGPPNIPRSMASGTFIGFSGGGRFTPLHGLKSAGLNGSERLSGSRFLLAYRAHSRETGDQSAWRRAPAIQCSFLIVSGPGFTPQTPAIS